MNRSTFSLMVAVAAMAALLGSGLRVQSQEAAVKKTPEERLIALKAANTVLLEKQQKTLQKMEELKELAEQLRIIARNR